MLTVTKSLFLSTDRMPFVRLAERGLPASLCVSSSMRGVHITSSPYNFGDVTPASHGMKSISSSVPSCTKQPILPMSELPLSCSSCLMLSVNSAQAMLASSRLMPNLVAIDCTKSIPLPSASLV